MDIVDIDEMIKDDSFFEEKNPDDLANMLKQLKNNNLLSIVPQTTQTVQSQQQQQQQQHEEDYKLNSRTFTRPKRKSAAQSLESQFLNINTKGIELPSPQLPDFPSLQNGTTPMLNVQIGGKVRTPLSARSLLQDTTPPSSFWTPEIPNDNMKMDSSLITSADFSNISFLLPNSMGSSHECDLDRFNSAGYTLSDLIRDRKALESLTLSSDDGALIKDSQIAQIDDISLALCKLSSGCSTMNNSTESVEGSFADGITLTQVHSSDNASSSFGFSSDGINRTVEKMPSNRSYGGDGTSGGGSSSSCNETIIIHSKNGKNGDNTNEMIGFNAMQHAMLLNNDEMICDTTFSVIENGESFIVPCDTSVQQTCSKTFDYGKQTVALNATQVLFVDSLNQHDKAASEATFSKETYPEAVAPLSKTYDAEIDSSDEAADEAKMASDTFDCLQQYHLPSQHTPEAASKLTPSMISTPHMSHKNFARNKIGFTSPSCVALGDENLNISPIVAAGLETREKTPPRPPNLLPETPRSRFDGMEMLEDIENPNETFNRRRQQQQQLQQEQSFNRSTIEMQNVMDLAQAEAELLAAADDGADDEEQFEHMLDELSRIELNPEQLKMKRSLETIKKRFHCARNHVERDPDVQSPAATGETKGAQSNTFTTETRNEALRQLRDSLRHETTTTLSSCADSSVDAGISSGSGADLFSHDAKVASLQNSKEFSGNGGGGASLRQVSPHSSWTTTTTSGSGSSERLLSRRSRLYDDINLLALSTHSPAAGKPDTLHGMLMQNAPPSTADETGSLIMPDHVSSNIIAPVVQQNGMNATETNETNEKTDDVGVNDESADDDAAASASKYKLSEKRERDRDRFKTMKIVKNAHDDNNSATRTELNVPCIDDDGAVIHYDRNIVLNHDNGNEDNGENALHSKLSSPERISRRDASRKSDIVTPVEASTKINSNFLTYKMPKDRQLPRLNRPEVASTPHGYPIEEPATARPTALPLGGPATRTKQSEVRSLSRPRYISGLQKFSAVSKAISAGNLEQTENSARSAADTKASTSSSSQLTKMFGARKPNATGIKTTNAYANTNSGVANAAASKATNELKSPMGTKAKSLHNLASNFGYTANSSGAFGLRKINSGGLGVEQQAKVTNLARPQKQQLTLSAAATATSSKQPKSDVVFKKPQSMSSVRPSFGTGATTGAAVVTKRTLSSTNAGITRPSSGYYSLNVNTKSEAAKMNSNQEANTIKPSRITSGNIVCNNNAAIGLEDPQDTKAAPVASKASGIRPPAKRSALPRPTSFVKR